MSTAGWEQVTLGDVAIFASGKTPPRSRQADYFDNGTIPWVKTLDLANTGIFQTDERITQDAIDDVKLQVHPAGSVLVAMYGGFNQIGRTGVLRIPAATNQAITTVVPNSSQLDSDYLLHVLNYRVDYWRTVASSSRKDPNITKEDVEAFPLDLPPLSEQRAIADAINSIDDLTAHLTTLIAKKQAIKRGVMQQLLTGRTRLPGFTGSWTSMAFNEVLATVNSRGSRIDASEYGEIGAIPVIDQSQDFIAGYAESSLQSIKPSEDGLLVFGDHTCVSKFIDFPFVVGADGTKVLRSTRPDSVKVRFIAYLLELNPVESTGYNRHFSRLRELEFDLPDVGEQRAIIAVLSDLDSEIAVIVAQLDSTRAVKTGMMQELLTGRTRLPIEEAVA